MPFKMTSNVAQYGGADWDSHLGTISGTTVIEARRHAVLIE
ncbi:hypothetical protein [Endothiovibrio diazotrophicus]